MPAGSSQSDVIHLPGFGRDAQLNGFPKVPEVPGVDTAQPNNGGRLLERRKCLRHRLVSLALMTALPRLSGRRNLSVNPVAAVDRVQRPSQVCNAQTSFHFLDQHEKVGFRQGFVFCGCPGSVTIGCCRQTFNFLFSCT
jgi:hypothetical protein